MTEGQTPTVRYTPLFRNVVRREVRQRLVLGVDWAAGCARLTPRRVAEPQGRWRLMRKSLGAGCAVTASHGCR